MICARCNQKIPMKDMLFDEETYRRFCLSCKEYLEDLAESRWWESQVEDKLLEDIEAKNEI